QRVERAGERGIELQEATAGELPRRLPEERLGPRVRERHALLEVERHHARRRSEEDLLEEPLLLLEPDPLLAEVVDHPVVDRDEAVELLLPRRLEARAEVALREERRARPHEL